MSPIDIVKEEPDEVIKTKNQGLIINLIDDFFQDVKQLKKGDELYGWKRLFQPILFEHQILSATHLRSIVKIAGPLDLSSIGDEKYDAVDGEALELQMEHVREFMYELHDMVQESNVDDEVEAIVISDILEDEAFGSLVARDAEILVYGIMVVGIFLLIFTSSLFLASIALLLGLLSFPIAAILTRGIFRVEYFGEMNLICILLIVKIASLNVYVMVDQWRQSARVSPIRLKITDK